MGDGLMVKNVLLATPTYHPITAGSSVYFRQLAKILRDSDDYNPFIVTEYDERLEVLDEQDGVPVIRLSTNNPNVIKEYSTPVLFIQHQFDAEIDLTHIHPHTDGVPTIFRSVVAPYPSIIYDCRGPALVNQRMIYGTRRRYLSINKETDEAIQNELSVNPEYIERMSIAVDVSHKGEPVSSEKENFRCIFIGTLHPHKGAHIAINAINNSERDIELVIAGDGGGHAGLVRGATKEYDFLEYIGEVSHDTVLAEIDRADALVAPFSTEGKPRVVAEAIKLNTPVVASHAGQIGEMVDDCGVMTLREEHQFKEDIHVVMNNYDAYKANTKDNDLSQVNIWDIEDVEDTLIRIYSEILE